VTRQKDEWVASAPGAQAAAGSELQSVILAIGDVRPKAKTFERASIDKIDASTGVRCADQLRKCFDDAGSSVSIPVPFNKESAAKSMHQLRLPVHLRRFTQCSALRC